ncbi:hypothetical protein ATANTOWER_000583 [Ataeniobius toweri]|uniref:Uncharacterized protein n=1 Tax=Ataeniobius toweri TaxID=208326 RepID=A0ABU7C7Y1_9TELE|nr:hypothetical protein [Ataeniobius toweri]
MTRLRCTGINTVIHSSSIPLIPCWVTGGWSLSPTVYGREAGWILDRSPIHRSDGFYVEAAERKCSLTVSCGLMLGGAEREVELDDGEEREDCRRGATEGHRDVQ